jgi:arylsulfatase A-like enzyme
MNSAAEARHLPTSPWFVPALAVAVAVATGVLEIPAALLRRELFLLPLEGDGHILWMAVVANLVLVAPVAVVVWGVSRIRPGRSSEQAAATVFLALGAYALLAYIPRVRGWAILILAIGLGVQGARLAMRRRSAFHEAVRRLAWALPLLVVLYAGAAFAWKPLRERWGHRGLPAAASGSPNVLLLVLDTVRSMRLSLYGYGRETTPALQRWARSGAVFDQAIATSPWTLPSHGGMFTGRYPHELNAGFRTDLDDRWPTLAEALAQRGYRTGGFSANRRYASYESGLARGFARYDDYRVSLGQVMVSAALGRQLLWKPWFQDLIGYYDLYGRKDAAVVTDQFLTWAGGASEGRPFFAFLNYYDAHDPYLAPAPFNRRFTGDTTRYRPLALGPGRTPAEITRALEAHEGTLAYLDTQIDRLLLTLESRGLLEHTLVILTSDHGEHFGEHGLMDHGNSLYRPLLEVPLLVRLPGRVPAGVRVRDPVTLRDLPATVWELTGGPDDTPFPGTSWSSRWRPGETAATPSPILSALSWPNGEIAYALRLADHSYIDWFQQKEELYDLRSDPTESTNLASQGDPDITAAYRAYRDSVGGTTRRPMEVGKLQGALTGIRNRDFLPPADSQARTPPP